MKTAIDYGLEEKKMQLKELSKTADEFCKRKGWVKDWRHGGCYLHLEASELIEALRGKRGNPAEEVADVLTALLSMAEHYSVNIDEVLEFFYGKKKEQ